jgi:hypothetical protein
MCFVKLYPQASDSQADSQQKIRILAARKSSEDSEIARPRPPGARLRPGKLCAASITAKRVRPGSPAGGARGRRCDTIGSHRLGRPGPAPRHSAPGRRTLSAVQVQVPTRPAQTETRSMAGCSRRPSHGRTASAGSIQHYSSSTGSIRPPGGPGRARRHEPHWQAEITACDCAGPKKPPGIAIAPSSDSVFILRPGTGTLTSSTLRNGTRRSLFCTEKAQRDSMTHCQWGDNYFTVGRCRNATTQVTESA